MSVISESILSAIGKTPLVELPFLGMATGAKVFAKLEYFNPGGSIKDRAALEMVLDAEERGVLRRGATIIEPTSGNTGIGLAMVSAARGYKCVIVMPDTMSAERIKLMRAYGAEVVLTDGKLGMSGAVKKAEELMQDTPGGFIPDQFSNPANALAHEKTTGPEIWEATRGEVDIVVASIGTGGTITGIGRYLKRQRAAVRMIGVEPESSPLLTEGRAGAHKIQGIGANFVPEVLDMSVVDGVMTVSDENAYLAGRTVGESEGLLVGISSGAALFAASELAAHPANAGKTIVVICPDGGSKYLSTPGYYAE